MDKQDNTLVTGMRVKSFTPTEGKNDKDPGKLKIVLEASKDDIRVMGDGLGELNLNDIVAALNIHQAAKEPIMLKLRFPDKK